MSGRMTRLINAEIAFQFDGRFPLALLMFEAAAGDAINGVRFEFRRFIERRYLLNGSIIVLFV